MEWYAIQTYSGSEQSVKRAIENLIVENKIQDRFEQIVVPTEAIYEDKKKITQRSLYPGYVFIKVELDIAFGACLFRLNNKSVIPVAEFE